MAKVSIICAAYNAERYIGEMIDSVLAQSFEDWELIIVNDGSADATLEIAQKKSQIDPRIRVFSQKNQGAAVARNFGFRESLGEFLMILDADDRILESALDDLVSGFEGKPRIGVVYGDTWFCDESGNRVELLSKKHPGNYKTGNVFGALLSGNMFAVHSALIKMDCIKDFQCLHLDTRMQIGDWELWVKVAKQCEFSYINKPVCEYRQHSLMSLKSDSKCLQFKQRDASFKRNIALARKGGVKAIDIGSACLEHAIAAVKSGMYLSFFVNMMRSVGYLVWSKDGFSTLISRVFN